MIKPTMQHTTLKLLKQDLVKQKETINKAIHAIDGLNELDGLFPPKKRPQRVMSSAARNRIAAAQRARWAKLRKRRAA